MIGTTTLFAFDRARCNAAIGYALAVGHWGKGLAREAVQCVVGFAFDGLGLQRIEANVDARNAASTRLLHALGFRASEVPGTPASADGGREAGIMHFLDRAGLDRNRDMNVGSTF